MNKPPIIILHGWGLKGSIYSQLAGILKSKGYSVFTPDMPGFGSEQLIKESMSLDDYVEYLRVYMFKNKINKTILIGHSFGGRISLKFAWRYPKKIEKMILTGVPVVRHMSIKKKAAYFAAVVSGKIFSFLPRSTRDILRKPLYFAIGEWDYYKAGPLSQVFKNIIQEDLIRYVIDIKLPILLVWGKEDKMTPSKDVAAIKRYNSKIHAVIIPRIGHKFPYEKPMEFADAMMPFLRES